VVVNIDNSRKTIRKKSDGTQQQQPQKQSAPQVIPIPYPVMQQVSPYLQPNFNNARVPNPNNPNPVFENHLRDLNGKINNLTDQFNTYGKTIMEKLNSSGPHAPVHSSTPMSPDSPRARNSNNDFTYHLHLPESPSQSDDDEPTTPIIRQPTRTQPRTQQTPSQAQFGITPIRYDSKFSNVRTPMYIANQPVNPNQHYKPNSIYEKVYGTPFMEPIKEELSRLEYKPPSDEFENKLEQANEKAIMEKETEDDERVDESIAKAKAKPKTKQQLERESKKMLAEEVNSKKSELRVIQDKLSSNEVQNYSGLTHQEKALIKDIIDTNIKGYNLNLDEYLEIVEKLQNGEIKVVSSALRQKLNLFIKSADIFGSGKILANVSKPEKALEYLEKSGVDVLISRKKRILSPTKEPAEKKKSNILSFSDLTQNNNSDNASNKNLVVKN
jgi:hypothetical protein